jgi:uncharacterized membrane protein (UPF0127 family)
MLRATAGRLELSLPETRRERTVGLRGKQALAPDRAMLFERCRSIQTFGMRFPILVVWLDAEYRVISVRRLPPRRLASNFRARHVLECSIDAAVRVGDVIELSGPTLPD